MRAHADLNYVAPDITWPFYYGRTEEFTHENGVFNVRRVQTIIMGDSNPPGAP